MSALAFSASPHAQAQDVLEISYVPTGRAQIAIWVERQDGSYLDTLALTQATAYRGIGNRPGASQMNSGFRWPYGRREGVLPYWAHRRATAAGAELFPRVIFQNRVSEGHASRSSDDFSRDDYYCLSFNQAKSTREALDAVSCASVFNSDKGRYVSMADLEDGYFEPFEDPSGNYVSYALDLFSLYPPRRDLTRCSTTGCNDHVDVGRYASDARRIMPRIDAVTMATPPGDRRQTHSFTWPQEWGPGDYVAFLEINVEGDYNNQYGPTQYPTPQNPNPSPATTPWDYWALSYGYPFRGQPAVVFRAPFRIDGQSSEHTAERPVGISSLSGRGVQADAMLPMDTSMTDNSQAAPGSGADRLRLQDDNTRLRVRVVGSAACEGNAAPREPKLLVLSTFEHRLDAHHFLHAEFTPATDDEAVTRYILKYSTTPIVSEMDFERALPAQAAVLDSQAIEIPLVANAGDRIAVDVGGLTYETQYYFALRAQDACNEQSPFVTADFTTPSIQFTTVSPCFVATASYGTPLAAEIGVLRRFRDRHLMNNPVGRWMVSAYYEVGPKAADFIREHDWARSISRTVLGWIVNLLD